jgi:sarcosine oxidase gamma subunit
MHEMPDEAETAMAYRLIMVMEKLHSIDDERLMDAAEANLISLGIPPEYIRDNNNSDKMSVFFASPERRHALAQGTNNPRFKEALELLEPYFEAFGQDMHSGNAMIRLTGSGPQIVIIDPLELG